LGADLAEIDISKFPNGEKRIWIKSSLQNKTAIILQSFSEPVDEHIIELALISDACKHLGASTRLAVIPWMGYSPQDKEFRKGEPISIHVIAKLIEAIAVDQVVTIDIHSRDSLQYFKIPITEISALPVFTQHFRTLDLTDHAVAALDKGAYQDSKLLAEKLDLPLIVFDKHRDRATGEVELKHVSGDVTHKHIITIDDFVSTGSTRITASHILKSMGAVSYTDCITHALLAADASQRLQASDIDSIIATDTYLVPDTKLFPKLQIVSVAHHLSQTIKSLIDASNH